MEFIEHIYILYKKHPNFLEFIKNLKKYGILEDILFPAMEYKATYNKLSNKKIEIKKKFHTLNRWINK